MPELSDTARLALMSLKQAPAYNTAAAIASGPVVNKLWSGADIARGLHELWSKGFAFESEGTWELTTAEQRG
jgi:hypothetical protein